MLVKCICTNCAGHLEFEDLDAGESIACPHCGFNTTLELPGAKKADPEMTSLIKRLVFRRRLIRWGTLVLVLAAAGFSLYHWGVPWIMDRVPEIESNITAMVVLVLLCLALPFVLFWLVFPALLFLQLRRIIQLLSQSNVSPESQLGEKTPAEAETEGEAEITEEETTAAP